MFETVGEIARWRIVYPHLRDADVDSLLSYENLSEILDVTDRRVIQNTVRRAGRELLRENSRAVEAVPNQGYRVVTAVEHLRMSKKQVSRGRRAVGRGNELVTRVDMNAVPAEMHKAFHHQQVVLGVLVEVTRRIDSRVRRHEAQLQAILPITTEAVHQIDNILDRLERAGIPD